MDFTIDRFSAILVGLLVVTQLAAIVAAQHIDILVSTPETQTANAEVGIGAGILVVVESLVIIALWRVWSRLPQSIRTVIKYTVVIGLWATSVYLDFVSGDALTLLLTVIFVQIVVIALVLELYDATWALFDALALIIGTVVMALFARAFAPATILPWLVVGMVWDYTAVNLTDLMGSIAEWSSSASIPNYLIIPNGWAVDLGDVTEHLQDSDGDPPEGLGMVLGLGDLILPGLLTVSAWIGGTPLPALGALIGTCIAMTVLRDSFASRDSDMPGLPWLNTGAIVGFGVGVLVSGVSVATALGL